MNEKERVLNLVKEGRISTEEATKLLDAIYSVKDKNVVNVSKHNKEKKNLKGTIAIEISSASGDIVDINLPLKIADLAVKFIPKSKIELIEKEGINIDDILSNIEELIDVSDEDLVSVESSSGDRIRIHIKK
ncbi:MAG: hypothetical protein CR982_01015 [Candidatus Cloacimonadota bacterium]|nr:MAG: hypothetical protein CR982_01015 [Candidatus Cloacimonadota bacterium]PIE77760.1 MAG: hypothetical protein CSA15_11235 [Candidatus Delongbacteria bacterium]